MNKAIIYPIVWTIERFCCKVINKRGIQPKHIELIDKMSVEMLSKAVQRKGASERANFFWITEMYWK